MGEVWDMKVRRYINSVKCKGVICVLSRASLSSRSVLKEMDYVKLFGRKSAAISLENANASEICEMLNSEEDREIASAIAEEFPPEKIFIRIDDLKNDKAKKLENTLADWGVYQEEKRVGPDFTPIDRYTSDLAGENERLRRQQQGYSEFDTKAIDEVTEGFGRKGLVVLDLGCSNGELTASRFGDDRFSMVIGIDYNAKDVERANAAGYGDKFHFFHMDIESDDFLPQLTREMAALGADKADVVFMALTLHHLKDPTKLLFRLYDVFGEDGKIVIRGSDDGGKLCYPESELMSEFFMRYDKLVKSVTDRFNGRKLYKQLSDAGYLNICMMYNVTDTCEKNRSEKVDYYNIGFRFREVRLLEMLEKNPNNEEIRKEVEWQINALARIKELFGRRDFWYCNVSYIAIASVR